MKLQDLDMDQESEKDMNSLVMIVSRASGAPVIANAIRYAAQLVRGKVFEVAKEEFAAVKKAGLKEILDEHKASQKPAAAEEEVKEPPKEVVTAQIPGIEVMDLEDAVKVLWKLGIYAESGMGCTDQSFVYLTLTCKS